MAAPDAGRRAGPLAARALPGLALALLALGAALLLPRFQRGAALLDVVALDLSASNARLRPGLARHAQSELARLAALADQEGVRLLVVAYARDVMRLHGPAASLGAGLDPAALVLAPDAELGSNLAGALELCERQIELGGYQLRAVHLLGDGTYTELDPSAALARWAAEGARIRWLPLPPLERSDLALLALELPDAVETGAPVSALVTLRWQAPATATPPAFELELEVGTAPPRRELHNIPPQALDGTPWSLRIPLGPAPEGRTLLRALARLPEVDAIPENNALFAELRASEGFEVAVVASREAAHAAASWARALDELAGISARAWEVRELSAALAGGAVLLSIDLDPRELPAPVLESHVRRGGAWVALAGWEWLAGWSSGQAPAHLLPLRPAPDDGSARDVLLLADGSGSMSGAPFARLVQAAARLAAAAPERDRLWLRVFTDALGAAIEVRVPAGPGGRGSATAALLAARAPGGPTDIAGALRSLAGEPSERPRLALLLSDGRDQRVEDDELAALRSALASARVRLVAIALGEQADLEFLQRVAGPDEPVRLALDGEDLDRLFTQELRKEQVREGVSLPVLASAGDAVSRLAAELRGTYASVELPPAQRLARAQLAEGAEALWSDDEGAPVLALRRLGDGHTVAVASAPLEGWAPAWVSRSELLAPILRALERASSADGPIRAQITRGTLRVEGVDPLWPGVILARLQPWPGVPSATGLEVTLTPPPHADLADGRREGALRAGANPATAAWIATLAAPGIGEPLASVLVAVPPPAELEHPPRRVGPLPEGEGAPGRLAQGAHPAAPAVLASGLLLLAASVVRPRRARSWPGPTSADQAPSPRGR